MHIAPLPKGWVGRRYDSMACKGGVVPARYVKVELTKAVVVQDWLPTPPSFSEAGAYPTQTLCMASTHVASTMHSCKSGDQ